LEKFVKDCIPWQGPHTGAGEEHKEEGAAETKHELTEIPHSPSPCGAQVGRT